MTNKEMLFEGFASIANKYGVKFDSSEYAELQMITFSGSISAACARSVYGLARALQLVDAERECKCLIANCGIDIVFDEHWERRVGKKEFEGVIHRWLPKVA